MYEEVSEFPSVTSIFAIKNFVVLRQSQYVAQADLNSRSSLPDSPVLGLQASDVLTSIPSERLEKTRREGEPGNKDDCHSFILAKHRERTQQDKKKRTIKFGFKKYRHGESLEG